MNHKTLHIAHKSDFVRRLFRQGIEAAQWVQAHPDFVDLLSPAPDLSESPPSKEALLEGRFGIPYFLAHQIVNQPNLTPFYLIIPSASVHWHSKKGFTDSDGYLRIPCLEFAKPFVWGSNVLDVLGARANADTLFLDIQTEPDYRKHRPKNGKPRSLMTDRALVQRLERREIAKDLRRASGHGLFRAAKGSRKLFKNRQGAKGPKVS